MQMADSKVLRLYPHVDCYGQCRSARMLPDPDSPQSEKQPRCHDITIESIYEDLTVPNPGRLHSTHVDPATEGRVWRKLDLRLLPVVTMFYFLSFLVGANRIMSLCTFDGRNLYAGPVQHQQRSRRRPAEGSHNVQHAIQHRAHCHLYSLHSR
jgi:hypothetical protein